MAQGEFTKEEAKRVLETVNEMFHGIPKSKRAVYIGHLNDVSLFLEEAQRRAPDESGVLQKL